MVKCFHEHKSRDTKWFFQRPYGEAMTGLFRNLRDYFPEIVEELWVIGYCVCGAEAGLQQDIERKMAYISNMNQLLAERHLSAAELTNPALKKEKVYLSFQDDIRTGPRGLKKPTYHSQDGWTCLTASRNRKLMGKTESTGTRS